MKSSTSSLKRRLLIVREESRSRPPKKWKLIVFHGRRRIETKPTSNLAALVDRAKQLKDRGIRFRVVCSNSGNAPPKGHPETAGQIWCPYCRAWSYFTVPKDGLYWERNVAVCQWCHIPEDDYWLRRWAGQLRGPRVSAKTERARARRVRRRR